MRVKKSRANIRVINTYSGKRLAKVNADARKLHLSYGQYVAKYGVAADDGEVIICTADEMFYTEEEALQVLKGGVQEC